MDPKGMLEEFPSQLRWEDIALDLRSYRTVTFCGMGGSGIVGDIAKVWLEKRGFDVPVVSYRGYGLPPYVKGREDLVICTSYSGNTEETASNLQEALKKGADAVVISSGGTLQDIARENNLDWHSIPSGYAPRYALGFMLSKLLSLIGIEREELEDVRESIEKEKDGIKGSGKDLAERLYGYVPLVYCTPLTQPAGFRFKTQINENSKTQCYYDVLSEMHHNEVVGLENPLIRSKFFFILMYDPKDHDRILRRVEITRQILKEYGIVPYSVSSEGNSYLSRLLKTIYVGDWTSYHLALKYGYDPLPVKVIDSIKKSLH